MFAAPARRVLALLALLLALLATATSASAAIVINEIESQGGVPGDWVELTNTGAATVDITGYVLKDGGEGNNVTIGAASIAPGAFFSVDVSGLGDNDSARLFDTTPTEIDSHSWASPAATTYGRCPDGTGAFTTTTSVTRNAANDCSTPALATVWPGASGISIADGPGVFGGNLSGLAYQPSGNSAPGVLWAVRNGPSTLFRLVWSGTIWTPDTANGWGAGKQLLFPGGGGVPDAEGVTLAAGDPNGIFVSIERDDSGGANNVSRPGVLRFDVSGATAPLVATREWNLTPDIGGLGANAGLEAVTWVPDSVLVAKGFKDETAGAAYSPASYPDHGNGLFFVGVEQDGRIIAFALNQSTGAFTKVATIASGFPSVMGLEFEDETDLLWVACDNTCDGKSARLDIAQSGASDGKFVVASTYARPADMPNLNNEGFAITPRAECSGGLKPVFYADDGNTNGHAIRAGKLNCTNPPAATTPPSATTAPPGTTAPAVVTPPVIAPPLTTPRDTAKPRLTKLRASRTRVAFTLSENARVTVTVHKRVGQRFKKVKAFTVGLKKGPRTVTFKPRIRASQIRRGTLRISVRARDAAGNRSATSRTTVR